MNENEIKIGVTGKILEGTLKDWFIHVEDDSENTGGYLILIFKELAGNGSEGYDDWVEDKDSLVKLFSYEKWKIQWLDKKCS
jgi:hypothetical protein